MKIISSFKDCYDWVPTMYGGGDPGLVYVRNSIPGGEHGFIRVEYNSYISLFSRYELEGYCFKTLFFCGKLLPLITTNIRDNIDYKLFVRNYSQFKEVEQKVQNNTTFWRDHLRLYLRNQLDIPYKDLKVDSHAVSIAKQIQQPVFVIQSIHSFNKKYMVVIQDKIPNLSEIGFASYLSPQLIYQEIEHFMGNVIKESPDSCPPVQVSDKQRIIQKGFDLKRSFRH